MPPHILAIDQGTSSSRALVFPVADGRLGVPLAIVQQEFKQHYPADGWVEHDPEEIWLSTLESCRAAIKEAGLSAADIACIGITNQRETTVVWDRDSGEAVYPAIVWQDRRTADYCRRLKKAGHEGLIQERTGLLLDPYFSASKLRWILHNKEAPPTGSAAGDALASKAPPQGGSDLYKLAKGGRLAFGTVDSFLLWRLTGGTNHFTDATNASRTMLFDIHAQKWDEDLLRLFDIPAAMLPEVRDCAADFGSTEPSLFGRAIPITGMIGDQQSAAFGQACFSSGMAKSTYGTGCFMLLNTGDTAVKSANRLLTTVAYRLEGEVCYALEGSIFMAGAVMQWLRDGLGLIKDAADSEAIARRAEESGVYMVPAFTGLGAPYWDPQARGAIFGMTRDTGVGDIVTAALMSVCYQTRDLVEAMKLDGAALSALRVDGGMAANDYLLQRLADVVDCPVHRPHNIETTALGAAYMAGLQAGLFTSLDEISAQWQLQQEFTPQQDSVWRDARYAGWQDAVRRCRSDT